MFITVSLLLIILFSFGFWIIKESSVPLYLKICAISFFFFFCVVFSIALDSAMGWAASPRGLPSVVTIRSVVVKEPDQQRNFKGSIYFLLDMPPTKYDTWLLSIFGHKTENIEPRLFKLPYSRPLHEQMEKNVIPKLMKGQVVQGKLGKGSQNGKGNGEGEGDGDGDSDGNGNGRSGQRGSRGANGGGSDSLGNDYQFYELPPSYFIRKH